MAGREKKSSTAHDLSGRRVITSIAPVPGDPAMRCILAAGRTLATVRDTDVEQLGLKVGMPLTRQRMEAIDNIVALNKARRHAMSLLGRRAYSSAMLTERLEGRGHSPRVAQQVVDELIEDHWVDDELFGRDLVEQALSREPAGKSKLLQKLASQMISADVAERVVDEALQEVDGRQQALDFVQAKLKCSSTASGPAVARRMAGFLARRGVDECIIEDVLQELGLLEDLNPGYD